MMKRIPHAMLGKSTESHMDRSLHGPVARIKTHIVGLLNGLEVGAWRNWAITRHQVQ